MVKSSCSLLPSSEYFEVKNSIQKEIDDEWNKIEILLRSWSTNKGAKTFFAPMEENAGGGFLQLSGLGLYLSYYMGLNYGPYYMG